MPKLPEAEVAFVNGITDGKLQASVLDLLETCQSIRSDVMYHGPSGYDPDDVLCRVNSLAQAVVDVVADLVAELERLKVDSRA